MTVCQGSVTFFKWQYTLNAAMRSYLYTRDYSTLCFLPMALCIQNPHERLQCTACSSAGSHLSMSLSTDSTNSTPATVHQLPKRKERQCKVFQERRLYREREAKLTLKMSPDLGLLRDRREGHIGIGFHYYSQSYYDYYYYLTFSLLFLFMYPVSLLIHLFLQNMYWSLKNARLWWVQGAVNIIVTNNS